MGHCDTWLTALGASSEAPTLLDSRALTKYLTGVHLTGVYLMGVHIMGVHLMGVHLMGVSCACISWACISCVYLIGVKMHSGFLSVKLLSEVREN